MSNPNYTFDKNIPVVLQGSVHCMAIVHNSIVVGGTIAAVGDAYFNQDGTDVTGVPRIGIFAFDTITRDVLPFDPLQAAPAGVGSILWHNNVLYIGGGVLQHKNGEVRFGAMALDREGNLLPWNPNLPQGASSYVRKIFTDGTYIFLAGATLGEAGDGDGVVITDPITGTNYGQMITVDSDGVIFDAIYHDSKVYVGGAFSQVQPEELSVANRNNFAVFPIDYTDPENPVFGATDAFAPNPNLGVRGLVVHGGYLYVTGAFESIAGQSIKCLARFDDDNNIDTGFDLSSHFSGSGQTALGARFNLKDGMLYVGRNAVAGTQNQGMFIVDVNTQQIQLPMTSFNGDVFDFLFLGDLKLVWGAFNFFLGDGYFENPMTILSWDLDEEDLKNFDVFSYQDAPILDLEVSGPSIFLAGQNPTDVTKGEVNPLLQGVIGFLSSGGQVGLNIEVNETAFISRMKVLPAGVGVCGNFTEIFWSSGLTDVEGFAIAGSETFNAKLTTDTTVSVYDFDQAGNVIYLAGDFTGYHDEDLEEDIVQPFLMSFDSVTGEPAGPWASETRPFPVFTIAEGTVEIRRLAVDLAHDFLYVGGMFDTVNGENISNLCRFFLSTGLLDTSYQPDIDNSSGIGDFDLDTTNHVLYVKPFTGNIGTPSATHARILEDGTFDPVFQENFQRYKGSAYSVVRYHQGQVYVVSTPQNNAFQPSFGEEYLGWVFSVNEDGTLGWFQPKMFLSGDVYDFAVFNGRLYVSLIDNTKYLGLEPTPGGLAAFYIPALPPVALPAFPIISFLNRRDIAGTALTLLKWKPVFTDVNGNSTTVLAYRVYRTNSLNLEDPVQIAEITTRDIRGLIDTMFTEEITGFYRYCVSAVNELGEGGKSCIAGVAQAQSDRI